MPMQNRKSRITEQVIFDVGACDKNLITSLCYYFVLYFLCIFAELFLLLSVETIANLSRESIVFICLGRPGSASYIRFHFHHWMPPSILQGPTHIDKLHMAGAGGHRCYQVWLSGQIDDVMLKP